MDYLFTDYDNSLIGRIKEVEAYHFYNSEAVIANETRALRCVRYVIEDILEWTPAKAVKQFDSYMIHLMKLDKVLTFIEFPPEVPFGDAKYILSLLYPDRVKLSQQDLIEDVFKSVLKGDGKQFPREYFVGGIGFKRFCYCLKYLIENKKAFTSAEEIYSFFNSPAGKRFLYEYRLKVPANQFSISMPDAIYAITKNEPHSALLYNFFQFQTDLKKLEKNESNHNNAEYDDEYDEECDESQQMEE